MQKCRNKKWCPTTVYLTSVIDEFARDWMITSCPCGFRRQAQLTMKQWVDDFDGDVPISVRRYLSLNGILRMPKGVDG
tara:strand:+ start:767 stop:1000 length:234 start_codon:yes stop_codon:yes gene_type:complete